MMLRLALVALVGSPVAALAGVVVHLIPAQPEQAAQVVLA
jgi:hypothetical protein